MDCEKINTPNEKYAMNHSIFTFFKKKKKRLQDGNPTIV